MKFQLRFKMIPFLLLSTSTLVFSQDVESAIAALNESIGPTYNVAHKGKMLLVESFREGKQVKLDKINVYELDTASIGFSSDENVVSVKCYSDLDGCVERVLIINKKKSYRKRLAFGVEEGRSSKEIETELRRVLIAMSNKY